jgi:hypothetical protein
METSSVQVWAVVRAINIVYLGRVQVSRTYLAWLTFGGTNGFNVRILDIYDASRLQGGLPFGGHQRMM